MNAPVLPPPPRKYTVADIFYLIDEGLIDHQARFELIDGAIVHMSPKGRHHEVMRETIAEWLQAVTQSGFRTLMEHTLQLEDGLMLEPDVVVYDAARRIADSNLTGRDLRLVIEVADSSLSYDLNTKAALYAAQGVDEYWVINAVKRTARVHRGPDANRWADVRDVPAGEAFAPLCAQEAVLRLSSP